MSTGHITYPAGSLVRASEIVAGNRLAEGKSGLTGLLGGPTRSEKD